MRNETAILIASCVALMACDAGRSTSGSATLPPTPVVMGALPSGADSAPRGSPLSDVVTVAYDPGTQTLTLGGDPFDAAGVFRRAPARDTQGFAAFENEAGVRRYLALVRTDPVHGLAAGVVGTPFRLDTQFGGAFTIRDEVPTLPVDREVRHVGDYAAVRNIGTNVGADASGARLQRVRGRLELELDFFTDRPAPSIEGAITLRQNADVPSIRYPDIVLRLDRINPDGTFTGEAAVNGSVAGTFGGVIAGPDAAASAGWVVIPGDQLERGAFLAQTP